MTKKADAATKEFALPEVRTPRPSVPGVTRLQAWPVPIVRDRPATVADEPPTVETPAETPDYAPGDSPADTAAPDKG